MSAPVLTLLSAGTPAQGSTGATAKPPSATDPNGFAALLQLATVASATSADASPGEGTQPRAQHAPGGGRHRATELPAADGDTAPAIATDPAGLLAAAPMTVPPVAPGLVPPSAVANAASGSATPTITAPAATRATTTSVTATPPLHLASATTIAAQSARAPQPARGHELVGTELSASTEPVVTPAVTTMQQADSSGRHAADADDGRQADASPVATAAVQPDRSTAEFALVAPTPTPPIMAPVQSSAPAARPALVEYPVDQPVLSAAVGALRSRTDGTHELTIALHPADLGAVRVHARLHDGTLDVTLSCADETAREAVTAALPALHQQLSAFGAGSIAIAADAQRQQPARQDHSGADQLPTRHQTPGDDRDHQQQRHSRSTRRDLRSELDQWM
jgi:flagellar hook-length control protein FliK